MDVELPPVFLALSAEHQELLKNAHSIGFGPDASQLPGASACCDRVLGAYSVTLGLRPAEAKAVATVWMLKGQIQERLGEETNINEALTSYDRGIALLEDVGRAGEPTQRELAGAWMNRGNCLQRTRPEPRLPDAVQAYQKTIDLLEADRAANPKESLVESTLGAAYLNKASALQRLNTREHHKQAIQACTRALEILKDAPEDFAEHFKRLRAGAVINRGGSLLATEGPAQAREIVAALNEVLKDFADAERDDPGAADIVFRARRLACEALGVTLQNSGKETPEIRNALVGEITDSAEEALRLAQHWDRRGFFGFRPVVPWFLHLASAIYAQFQPQFLSEFLLDILDGSETPEPWKSAQQLRQIALQTVDRLRAHLRSRVMESVGSEDSVRWSDVLTDLQQLHSRLSTQTA
jgi:tetratricopeptide (TPR) repeat protein